mmetsp:Transcript_4223/g.9520  ORF Transcript_4223/g.9520 Transcript_4223/m.9520 type:complete len:362 (+) Transcript_4223:16-1101(+)
MALSLSWIFFGLLCFQLVVAPQPPDPDSSGTGDSDDGDNYCSVDGQSCAPQQPASDVSKQKWKWDPTSKSHPCNIRRISQSELLYLYGDEGVPNLYPHPLVIYPDAGGSKKNGKAKFANRTTLDNLPLNFPHDFHVTLTGSDSLSSHRRSIPLKQYLREVLTANNGSGETLPDQLGNETWYLFGETFTDEWAAFLQNYELPLCQSCTQFHREQNLIALCFGVGNIGSGVQWHLHGPGFSETIHGRKHWVLYPPEHRPEYDLDYASRHWMENTYPELKDWTDVDLQKEKKGHEDFLQRLKKRSAESGRREAREVERGPSSKKPWECTINRGEMIYFPDQWHHATINLEPYTVFVSSFTTEHQ